MAHTKISELFSKARIMARERRLMYGNYKYYGQAVNQCIKENIDIKNIRIVLTLDGKIDFYTIDYFKPTIAKAVCL